MSIIREHISSLRETSIYLPSRDSTSPLHNYRKISKSLEHGHGLANAAGNASRALAAQKQTTPVSYEMHPFKVYQVPLFVRQAFPLWSATPPDWNNYDYTADWRTIRVRSGNIFFNAVEDEFEELATVIAGDSQVGNWPYLMNPYSDAFVTDMDGSYDENRTDYRYLDIKLEEGKFTWIWLDYTGNWIDPEGLTGPSTPILKAGPDPALEASWSSSNIDFDGWGQFPKVNSVHYRSQVIPIAIVDSETLKDKQLLIIRQFATTDLDYSWVVNPPATLYGPWSDPGDEFLFYPKNAIVTYDYNPPNNAWQHSTETWRGTFVATIPVPDAGSGSPPTENDKWEKISEYRIA